MYGVDARKIIRLADFGAGLMKAAQQKFRGTEAEYVKSLITAHNRHMDETIDENLRLGGINIQQIQAPINVILYTCYWCHAKYSMFCVCVVL